MRFGLQKMTLLDYPGKVSCTVFTSGCNFRCPFCHNASLVKLGNEEGMLEQAELLEFLRRRTGILEGVCVTGGEPLLHPELVDFLVEARSLDYPVKLDTNGSFPEQLKYVVENGLVNYVAMDIKNTLEKYPVTAGFTNPALLESVQESIAYLMQADVSFEFRTTVVKGFHTPEDFAEIGRWLAGAPRYFLQKYKDSGDVLGDTAQMGPLSDDEMRQCLAAIQPFVPDAALRGVD